jgi:hypothetical protein
LLNDKNRYCRWVYGDLVVNFKIEVVCMAMWEDLFAGKSLTGIAIGIGVAALAPVLTPVIAGVVKPAAKAAIKGGIVLYDRGREAVAETVEVAEDLMAEARSELESEGVAGQQMGNVQKQRGVELTSMGEEPQSEMHHQAEAGEGLGNA